MFPPHVVRAVAWKGRHGRECDHPVSIHCFLCRTPLPSPLVSPFRSTRFIDSGAWGEGTSFLTGRHSGGSSLSRWKHEYPLLRVYYIGSLQHQNHCVRFPGQRQSPCRAPATGRDSRHRYAFRFGGGHRTPAGIARFCGEWGAAPRAVSQGAAKPRRGFPPGLRRVRRSLRPVHPGRRPAAPRPLGGRRERS